VVQGGVIQPLAAGRPCADGATATAPVATTTAQTQVRLTVPADCVGRTVQATVVDAAGVPHSSAPTVLTAVTQDVAVGAYTAAATMQVGAAVDGWGLATTWSWTPPRLPVTCRIPSNPAQTCTAT
ncbi:hypothetical protein ACQUZK_09560, partial [Streptococcus pyogenes]|uniref:hypothetical protein n=1 Tax=Streptococcus pyogenes TaxID=1314 RepID=UPI003DA12B8E